MIYTSKPSITSQGTEDCRGSANLGARLVRERAMEWEREVEIDGVRGVTLWWPQDCRVVAVRAERDWSSLIKADTRLQRHSHAGGRERREGTTESVVTKKRCIKLIFSKCSAAVHIHKAQAWKRDRGMTMWTMSERQEMRDYGWEGTWFTI